MGKKRGRRTTEAVGVMTKERVREQRRRRLEIIRKHGGKGYRRHMREAHRKRLAKRKQHQARAEVLRARATRRVPMMVSSMVGSPSPRKFGVYGKGFVLQWFPTRKLRRDFITGHPGLVQWKWPKQSPRRIWFDPRLEQKLFGRKIRGR